MNKEEKQKGESKQKVYAILYNSYEFDDLSYGDLTPKYMSLNVDTVIKEFERIKKEEISQLYNTVKLRENWLNEHPEYKEDYKVKINTDDEFEVYVGNWCYHYVLTEYELH